MRWEGPPPPAYISPGFWGWVRVLLRAIPMIMVLLCGLVLMLVLRVVERPVFGARRPITPWITVIVCRVCLAIMGLRREQTGTVAQSPVAFVANHASWLDIFVLNAAAPLYFVAKSEVASWPGVNVLAKATGTEFIERRRSEAAAQVLRFAERAGDGHRLAFFPEGTSTDGLRVLPFKSTLFEAFLNDSMSSDFKLQPVAIRYLPDAALDGAVFGFWGDMTMGHHAITLISQKRLGRVRVAFLPARGVAGETRKSLAQSLGRDVEEAFVALGSTDE